MSATTLPPPPAPPAPPSPAPPPPAPAVRPRPGVRTAWIVAGSILSFVVLGWGTAQTVSLMSRDRFTETATFDASGITGLEVDNGLGDVEVLVGGRDEVVVDTSVDAGLQPPDRDVRVVGDTVVVRGSCDGVWTVWCSVEHSALVPTGIEVQVFSGDGDVRIEGDLGRISVVANEGDVEIRVPGRMAYAVDAVSVDGEVAVEVPTDPSAGRVIYVRVDEGDVSIRPLP
jgi:Putative adhesin